MAKATPPNLADKIAQAQDDAAAFVNARAERLREDTPGVPIAALVQLLTAQFPGCPCRSALKLIGKDES